MQAKSIPSLGRILQEPCEAQRQADIPAAIDDLERSVNRMGEAVQNLWGRLDSVLRSELSNKEIDNAPSFGECQTSRAIRTESQRLDELTRGVEKMIGLIEV
jgi:hypothetical protein